jgi:hypothetical protein
MGRTRSSQQQRPASPAALDRAVLGLAVTARRLVALPGEEPRRMRVADMKGAG